MDPFKTSDPEAINLQLRCFFGTAAMTIAATQLAMSGSVAAQSTGQKTADLPKLQPGTSTSFGPLKQIDAGVLSVGYAEAGPADGPTVMLLHGWPYDIHSFVDVAPLLASAGYRVIVPYLRGYGTTRFLSADTVRNGQPSALAVDIVALMDALKIERPIIGGFDWGARTAAIIAALWPERCKALISVSGTPWRAFRGGRDRPRIVRTSSQRRAPTCRPTLVICSCRISPYETRCLLVSERRDPRPHSSTLCLR